MISKEKFIEIIKRLRDYNDLQNKIQDLFRDSIENQEQDFANAGSICIGHETIVVELLENMFNDKDTISWWLFERDYGRDVLATDVQDNDGKYIDLTTPEKLYDYLLSEMEVKYGNDT